MRTLTWILALFLSSLPVFGAPQVSVDCARGERLGPALERRGVQPLKVSFRGTCTERVVIDRDDVVLRGADATATLVGSVRVDGASRVRLESFLVRDTPGPDPFSSEGDGVQVLASQKVTIDGVRTQNTGRRGVSIEDSSADLVDVSILGAGGAGFQGQGSSVNLFGTIEIAGSVGPGLFVASMAHVFLRRHASLVATGNAIGVAVQGNGTLTFSNETQVAANENLALGILVTSQGDLLYGSTAIEMERNGGPGLVVSEHGNWTPFQGFPASIRVADNAGPGIVLERGGFLELADGATEVTGNSGLGISVDDSRAVLANVLASGNGAGDVSLAARASVICQAGVNLATPPTCDDSVQLRGSVSCPPAAP